ncbi:MAG: hypothetical protein XU15_C0008G0080 [candidate division NC10 bacterium CSP1-5]|nr:MAG: hypothetical protein XU15_C0008G0080 [candidate division NC10 bacterium CSP1-5]
MFDAQATTRCHQVLCEVMAALGETASEAYLIGGWAIYYVLDRPDRPVSRLPYAGTLDVDVALAFQIPKREELVERLVSKGYVRDKRIVDRLLRPFPEGEVQPVAVDFLGGDKEVLQTLTQRVGVVGKTPEGVPYEGSVAVARMEACLAMKAIAFDRDPKDKDAYDIYYLVTYARDEQGDCADHVKATLEHPLIRRGLDALTVHFGRREGRGLQKAMQMLRDQDGMNPVEARATVRASLRAFFRKLGHDVNY